MVPTRAMDSMVIVFLVTSLQLMACILGQQGFISIDCGMEEGGDYSHPTTRLLYVSDAGFIDGGAGRNAAVNMLYDGPDMEEELWYRTVRYFPGPANLTRGCYTLGPVVPGDKNLVRAAFYYGNYDRLGTIPVFDIHLGVNRWTTVNVSAAAGKTKYYVLEAVAVSTTDFLQVCVVNIGLGTPFISGLELRRLGGTMYPDATVRQSLLLRFPRPSARDVLNRYHFQQTTTRYPSDQYDRIWRSYRSRQTNISTSATIDVSNIRNFDVQPMILQKAITPDNGTRIDLTWRFSDDDKNLTWRLLLYFAELQKLASNEHRQFDILVDNAVQNGRQGFTPMYLSAEVVQIIVSGSSQHIISLVSTPEATHPPILNAFEIYLVKQMTLLGTNNVAAKAMMTIRRKYRLIKKNWVGDPCQPNPFAWDGLNCSGHSSVPYEITTLRLNSSGLNGPIDSSFGDLKSLQYLDLSNNSLSGEVPDFLAQMPSLTFLDLSSNNLSGSIPEALLEKQRNGYLALRISNNANLCDTGASTCELPNKENKKNKKKKRTFVIATVVPLTTATLLLAASLILYKTRKQKEMWMPQNSRITSPQDGADLFGNTKFTHKELILITSNFKEEIGRGGFGSVFLGYLQNGSPVAVKMRSNTSSQGDKEFLAEAQYLTRVHHKNLVTLIGYCTDKKHLALVYEYMHGGNLEDCLRGEASIATPLTWHQRLKIALDSAQGLEYLHKSCQPQLIHRDVKTTNILLSDDLEAKIADFGLMKAFANKFRTHVTTQPAGTLGYLDPEYYNTFKLSEKSDVYSFGVVLLELITGQPPVVPISADESIHIAQWVHQKLSEGNVDSIADPRMMRGEYDVDSVWKVAELALKCKDEPALRRPTMTDIVLVLKESFELEMSHAMNYDRSVQNSSNNLTTTIVDFHSEAHPSNHPRQQLVL